MFQAAPTNISRTLFTCGICHAQLTLPPGVKHTPKPCPNCHVPLNVSFYPPQGEVPNPFGEAAVPNVVPKLIRFDEKERSGFTAQRKMEATRDLSSQHELPSSVDSPNSYAYQMGSAMQEKLQGIRRARLAEIYKGIGILGFAAISTLAVLTVRHYEGAPRPWFGSTASSEPAAPSSLSPTTPTETISLRKPVLEIRKAIDVE
jgi:hypothetical protein